MYVIVWETAKIAGIVACKYWLHHVKSERFYIRFAYFLHHLCVCVRSLSPHLQRIVSSREARTSKRFIEMFLYECELMGTPK